MVSKVTLILELLSDGKWHRIEELLLRVGLNEREFADITEFLDRYNFVKVHARNRRVRINRDFQKLLVNPIA